MPTGQSSRGFHSTFVTAEEPCHSWLDQESSMPLCHSWPRPGIQFAFVSFLAPTRNPVCLCVIPGPDQESSMPLCHSWPRPGIQEYATRLKSGFRHSPPVLLLVFARNDIYARILLLLKIYVELGLIPAPVVDKLKPLDE